MNARNNTYKIVYLDNAATTPCDPRVVEEMIPYMSQYFGNASSTHVLGQISRKKIDELRRGILSLINGGNGNLFFTSGATESNNIAAYSLLRYTKEHLGRNRVLCLCTEHKSITRSVESFSDLLNIEVRWIPVGLDGLLDVDWLRAELNDKVGGVIVQLANSETGVIQDVSYISHLAHNVGAVVFSDITQAVGRIPIDISNLGVDFASFSGHKFYGPKGCGALYVRQGMKLAPITFGGGQEFSVRPGTENVSAIVGMHKALELSVGDLVSEARRITSLRQALWDNLRELGGIRWNATSANLLPSHLNLTIENVNAQDLILRARTIAFSAGSACNASTNAPSEVLINMGLSKEEAEQTIRISLGRFTTNDDIAEATNTLKALISDIRHEIM